jgi:hypothetical protein
MQFNKLKKSLDDTQFRLTVTWRECWKQARKEIRGNWQDPEIMARSRQRAQEIADAQPTKEPDML